MQYNKTVLQQALERVLKAVPMKTAKPVLKAVKVEVEIGSTTLSGTDQDIYISTRIDSDTNKEETFFVPGRLFASIISTLSPRMPVELRNDGQTLHIQSGRSSFQVPLIPGDEYPNVPALDEKVGEMSATELRHHIDTVKPFVATENLDVLRFLQSVHMVADGGILKIEGTDRHSATVFTIPWDGKDFEALIPGKPLFDALSMLSIGEAELMCDDGRFGWKDAHTYFSVRLIGEDFPTLERLMNHPAPFGTVMTFKVEDLNIAIKQLKTVHTDKAMPIIFYAQDGGVKISSNSNDGSSIIEVDAEMLGEPQTFGLDPDILSKSLSTMAGIVVVAMDKSDRPLFLSQDPEMQEHSGGGIYVIDSGRKTLVAPKRILA